MNNLNKMKNLLKNFNIIVVVVAVQHQHTFRFIECAFDNLQLGGIIICWMSRPLAMWCADFSFFFRLLLPMFVSFYLKNEFINAHNCVTVCTVHIEICAMMYIAIRMSKVYRLFDGHSRVSNKVSHVFVDMVKCAHFKFMTLMCRFDPHRDLFSLILINLLFFFFEKKCHILNDISCLHWVFEKKSYKWNNKNQQLSFYFHYFVSP